MPGKATAEGTISSQEFRENFAEFERGVLQDNIILCDQKSGILLAFAAAMILICLQGFDVREAHRTGVSLAIHGAFAIGAVTFLVSCHFALATVFPRIRRGADDHIFWESEVFKLPVDRYVARFRDMDIEVESENRLRYLHTLASICRAKFRHFRRGIRLAQVGFIILILAYIGRSLG